MQHEDRRVRCTKHGFPPSGNKVFWVTQRPKTVLTELFGLRPA